MRRIFIPVLVVFVLLPFSVSAETYYVDASRPDDSGDGLSEATAWQTISKVNNPGVSINPGDAILFKRGKVWRGQLKPTYSGSSEGLVTFGAYGTGNDPVITASKDLSGATWTSYSGNIWYNDDLSGDPHMMWLDDESYWEADNADSVDSANRWYWDSGATRVYVYATSNPASFYSSIDAPNEQNAAYIENRGYLRFENIHFKYGQDHAMVIIGASATGYHVISNCTIEGGGQYYGTLIIAQNNPSCTLEYSNIHGKNKVTLGDSLYINGAGAGNAGNNTIRHNVITDGSHACIGIKDSSGNLLEYNEIYVTDPYWFSRGIGMGGTSNDATRDNIIRYNYFHDDGGVTPAGGMGKNQFGGNNNKIYYNIFANCGHDGVNIAGGSGTGTGVCNDNEFYNNVIYGADRAGLRLSFGTGASGNKIYNNIIFGNDVEEGGYEQIYYRQNPPNIDAAEVKNNLIYDTETSDTVWIRYGAESGTHTVAYMESNHPDYWADNVAANPLFTGAGNDDFNLNSISPCIDNGTNVGLTLDFEGNSVPYGPLPDMGAYEYGSQPSGCTGTCRQNPCDTYDYCTDGLGSCVTGYCCSGACSLCNNTICETGEDCSSCPEDCGCVFPEICCDGVCSLPACFNESDCGTDPCKVYTCSNPGTCSASCSSQDITSCVNNDSCCPPGCKVENDNDCIIPGPVAWYHFDENFGTNATDSSGNGNDGTVYGAWWTSDNVSGYALYFDGVDDYVDIANYNDLSDAIQNNFTYSFWVKYMGQSSASQWPFLLGPTSTHRHPGVRGGSNYGADPLYLEWGRYPTCDGSSYTSLSAPSETDGEWHNIVFTYDGSNVIVYFDGQYYNQKSQNGMCSGFNNFQIGMYYNGIMDEVRIYDRALNEEEISEHYDEGTGNYSEADLNTDGSVDILDLGIIAANFGKTSGYDPRADVVDNNEIDVFDLVFVASRFT